MWLRGTDSRNRQLFEDNIIFVDSLRSICSCYSDGQKNKTDNKNSLGAVSLGRGTYKYNGSFTVEAALVIPLILAVIVSFLHIAMFCHDKAALSYLGERACLVAVYEHDENQICSKAKHIFEEEAEDELMGRWNLETKVYINGDNLELTTFATSSFWKVTVNSKAKLP